MSKFGNRKTVIDGISFDSQAEAHRYFELCLLQKAGQITDLIVQPRFVIWQNVKGGKATQTPLFKMKVKMFKAAYPQIIFKVVES